MNDNTFLRDLPDSTSLPALDRTHLLVPRAEDYGDDLGRPLRVLMLYGSLRPRAFSRLCLEEAARLLLVMGCEVRIFDPSGLPAPDEVAGDAHPKVAALRAHSTWSDGHVWCSPERHGAITGLMKTQIDHLPLSSGGVRPTQGRTLAVMQVSGGSQSFNTVNTMRLLGRWMRMVTIPNQSSVPTAYTMFDDAGRMAPGAHYDRIVDVMVEFVQFTYLTRRHAAAMTDRYSERREIARKAEARAADHSAVAVAPQRAAS